MNRFKPTLTFKDQSSQHMGLLECTQSSHLSAGFIRITRQTILSNQMLHTKSNTIRHIQDNRWVYEATIQAIFPVGFIRILRKLEGRNTKLVSSSTELRTPSQDLSVLASPLPTHPTQGSVPFSAQQSLRLHLPFQCSSGCAGNIHQPLLSYCEAPL